MQNKLSNCSKYAITIAQVQLDDINYELLAVVSDEVVMNTAGMQIFLY